MLGTINPEILFLQQEDQIKAGLLDMKMILKITEDTYKMLGQGQIQNPPKVHLGIPEGTEWESFFNTMPSYIGGDMNIAGIKWAAESKKNATTPGIPYGIDISILSDPVTVLPFCIQDGTIITAMRTSAVAGEILCSLRHGYRDADRRGRHWPDHDHGDLRGDPHGQDHLPLRSGSGKGAAGGQGV